MNLILLRYRWHLRVAAKVIFASSVIASIVLAAIWKWGEISDDLAALRDARETVAQLTQIVEGRVIVSEGKSRYGYVMVAVDKGER